jgi:membrane fusion protein, multidrug efflux system
MSKGISKFRMKINTTTATLYLAITLLGVACGGDVGLNNLNADWLRAEKTRFQDSINRIEAQLIALDTTKNVVYPKVTLFVTTPMKFEHYFSAQGYVESEQNVLLIPEVGGIVRSLNVSEGELVQKGQVIATFDAALVASNIKEIEEQIELAEYNYTKQSSLFDQGVGTEFNLKQAEAQLKTLQKTLNTLNTQAGKSTLMAPFSGYIEELLLVVGEMSTPGMPVARLINLDRAYVTADISEVYLSKLNRDNFASISFSALELNLDSLKVSHVGRFVNPANRTIKVRVELPKNDKFIPNLVATIKIRDYLKDSAIIIPSSTITQDSKGADIVFIAEPKNNHYIVSSAPVETGMTYKGMTEILGGVSADVQVIDKGSQSVFDGLEVEELTKQN